MGALISYINLADSGTVTNASGGTNILPATNTQLRQLGKVMRQSLGGGQSIILDFDLGAAQNISYVGLFKHNIFAGTFQVDLGTSSGSSNVATLSGDLWQGVASDLKQQHIIFDQTYAARYVRVTLTPNSPGEIELGRVWIDDPWTPDVSIRFEHQIVDDSKSVVSYGRSVYTFEIASVREMVLQFPKLTEQQALGSSSDLSIKSAHHMETTVGKHAPVVIIPELSGADPQQVRHKLGFYGCIRDAGPLQVMESKDANGGWYWTKRLVVREEK